MYLTKDGHAGNKWIDRFYICFENIIKNRNCQPIGSKNAAIINIRYILFPWFQCVTVMSIVTIPYAAQRQAFIFHSVNKASKYV